MVFVKFLFLFGVFPFQRVVTEVSLRLNFGYLFFFLVVSKFPALIIFLKVLKLY